MITIGCELTVSTSVESLDISLSLSTINELLNWSFSLALSSALCSSSMFDNNAASKMECTMQFKG